MNGNKFGFDFGSMTVTRTCQDFRASTISVKTKKASFSVRATNNGSLRFFDDQGNECELVNKEYIKSLTQNNRG
tara:strand:+ start:250 stop:471 length:222 start_codon:yes stop_codon:yes gene_type:complete